MQKGVIGAWVSMKVLALNALYIAYSLYACLETVDAFLTGVAASASAAVATATRNVSAAMTATMS